MNGPRTGQRPDPRAGEGAVRSDAAAGDRSPERRLSDDDRRAGAERGARQADEAYQQRRVRAAIQRELAQGAAAERPDAAEPGPASCCSWSSAVR